MFRRGIDKKIGDIATIIDEGQLAAATGPVPLDELELPRERILHDEIVTAVQGLKDIAEALIQGCSEEDQVRHARKLMTYRQSFKLLARAHFPDPTGRKK